MDATKQHQAEVSAQALADTTGQTYGVSFEKQPPEIGSPMGEQHKVRLFTPTEAKEGVS